MGGPGEGPLSSRGSVASARHSENAPSSAPRPISSHLVIMARRYSSSAHALARATLTPRPAPPSRPGPRHPHETTLIQIARTHRPLERAPEPEVHAEALARRRPASAEINVKWLPRTSQYARIYRRGVLVRPVSALLPTRHAPLPQPQPYVAPSSPRPVRSALLASTCSFEPHVAAKPPQQTDDKGSLQGHEGVSPWVYSLRGDSAKAPALRRRPGSAPLARRTPHRSASSGRLLSRGRETSPHSAWGRLAS